MKIDFDRAVENLKRHDNFLIITHLNPDGDTVGGGFALCLALCAMGKSARVINNDPFPEKFDFITRLHPEGQFEHQYIVSVDVADEKLFGDNLMSLYGGKADLAIDHHATHREFAKETYVEPNSASACEVVFKIIKALGVKIDKPIANCLYTGISTDTGCFKFSSVSPSTHIAAAELIECGADHAKIDELMFDSKKLSYLRLEGKCLENMKLLHGGSVCIFVITRKMAEQTGCDDSEFGGIVALSRQIEGVKIGVTLKERKSGKTDVSLRTNEEYDSSYICSLFGGGGHIRAAGCSFNCGVAEAEAQLVSAIDKIILGENI